MGFRSCRTLLLRLGLFAIVVAVCMMLALAGMVLTAWTNAS